MKKTVSFQLAGLVTSLLLIDAIGAARADVLPGAAMPEQVTKSLRQQQPKPIARPVAPVAAPQPQAQAANAEAQKIKFKLSNIVLKGNRVYTVEQLSVFYKDKLHKEITVADLFLIVQNITNYYRNNGYIISRAILPPQHVKEGTVEIQVIEGYIDQVKVSGNDRGSKCLVAGFGRRIRQCPPLKLSEMEYYLTLANEIPATQVKAVLSPSKDQPGAADLIMATETTKLTGYLSYDNYGTRYIGPQQMTANMGINSMIAAGDTTQLTVTKTPKGGELTYLDLNYNTPIDDRGNRWMFGSTKAHTHPLFVLRPSQIDGLNNNYYTSMQFPIIRERTSSLTIQTSFNYNDSTTTSFSTQLYTDHVRSLGVSATYNFADRFYGSNLITSEFRQGLPIFGYTYNTNPETAETSRPGGHADYTKITMQASRLQAIKGPWSMYGVVKGQWAFNPLLSSEQFSFGGNPLGRGYDVAELIGDKGAAGSLELRYDLPVNQFSLQALQFYTFYDAGMVWNMLTPPGTPGSLSATSVGIGTRFFFNKYVSGNFMWTKVLTKDVAAEEIIHQGYRPRVFFSIVASFS